MQYAFQERAVVVVPSRPVLRVAAQRLWKNLKAPTRATTASSRLTSSRVGAGFQRVGTSPSSVPGSGGNTCFGESGSSRRMSGTSWHGSGDPHTACHWAPGFVRCSRGSTSSRTSGPPGSSGCRWQWSWQWQELDCSWPVSPAQNQRLDPLVPFVL